MISKGDQFVRIKDGNKSIPPGSIVTVKRVSKRKRNGHCTVWTDKKYRGYTIKLTVSHMLNESYYKPAKQSDESFLLSLY